MSRTGKGLGLPLNSWGGSWTEQKLDAFEKYVNAYLTIMNKYRDQYGWRLIYFDGFAGSGSRTNTEEGDSTTSNPTFRIFEELDIGQEELTPYKGAAERVLNITQKGFDYYYFIDKSPISSEKLKEKLNRFQDEKRLVFKSSDANEEIARMATAMHQDKNLKSLVLLDPFGMQVDWDSIKLLENTGSDLWILIPTGVIVNRLLDKKGKLEHIERLSSFFGMEEMQIRDYFYSSKRENTLFGEAEIVEKISDPIKRIAELYIKQMQTIFKFVTKEPLVLFNTRNVPIFHFAFASNNETAVKIAHEIINK